MGKKRLFVAVELPDEIKKELQEICRHFQERKLFIGNCTEYQNLHVTLKFIGSVDENVIPKIDEALKNVYAQSGKATLSFLGVFPTRRIIKILFADLDCFCLSILAKQIEQSLDWIADPESREFKNHTTLARVKKIENKEDFLYAVDNFEVKPIFFEIKKFVLLESELTLDGPVYKAISSYDLF